MKIGPLDVETVPIPASVYLRISRLECESASRTSALLGLAVPSTGLAAPNVRDVAAVEVYGDAVLDHFVDRGATFEQIQEAAFIVIGDVSRRLGFTKAEVKTDADFSAATGDGSEPG